MLLISSKCISQYDTITIILKVDAKEVHFNKDDKIFARIDTSIYLPLFNLSKSKFIFPRLENSYIDFLLIHKDYCLLFKHIFCFLKDYNVEVNINTKNFDVKEYDVKKVDYTYYILWHKRLTKEEISEETSVQSVLKTKTFAHLK